MGFIRKLLLELENIIFFNDNPLQNLNLISEKKLLYKNGKF